MKKGFKKSAFILSAALGISLIGQIVYAQTPINFNFRLPSQGYMTTGSMVKDNSDNHADCYVSYLGWKGSGINWWICNNSGKEITGTGFFNSTGKSVSNYKSNGSNYKGSRVYAKMKTDSYTWNDCDVRGNIYP